MPLLEFAAHPEMTNFVSKMFGPYDFRRFSFIGICEDYFAELDRLADVLGWAYRPQAVVENVNPKKSVGRPYAISPAIRAQIENLNHADYLIYNYAKSVAATANVGSPVAKASSAQPLLRFVHTLYADFQQYLDRDEDLAS
jgi:hypothetical protein